MAKRPVAQRAREATILAGLHRLFAERETTALALRDEYGQPPLESLREVDALTPAINEIFADAERAQRHRILLALVLITGAVGAVLGATYPTPSTQTCTFADGSIAPGQCMFFDDFNTLNTSVWNAEDNWNGPLQN